MGNQMGLALGLFIVAMLQTVILGLYTVLSPMIQALFQNRKGHPLLPLWCSGEIGPTNSIYFGFSFLWTTLSTTIALMVPIVLMYREIQTITQFNRTIVFKRTLLGSILTVVMLLGVLIAGLIFGLDFPTKWPCIEHDLYHRHWRIRSCYLWSLRIMATVF